MKEIQEDYRVLGLKKLAERAIYMHREYLIYRRDLDEEDQHKRDNNIRLEIIENSPESIIDMVESHPDRGMRDFGEMFRENLANNYRGVAAFSGDTMVGFKWWVNNVTPSSRFDIQSIRREINMVEGDLYGFGFYVSPLFRRKGFGIQIQLKFIDLMRSLGYKRIFNYVRADNAASRRTFEKMGCYVEKITRDRRILLFLYIAGGKKIIFSSHFRLRD